MEWLDRSVSTLFEQWNALCRLFSNAEARAEKFVCRGDECFDCGDIAGAAHWYFTAFCELKRARNDAAFPILMAIALKLERTYGELQDAEQLEFWRLAATDLAQKVMPERAVPRE